MEHIRQLENLLIIDNFVRVNLSSTKTIKQVLVRHGVRPSKGLGQNFLIDRRAVRKLVAATRIQKTDTVFEIGPGMGAVTRELAARAKKVIAVEKDRKMVEILKETLAEFHNVEIIHGDALHTPYPIRNTPYKVVANLPYYITAPVIRKLLELCEARPSTITLMVQKEVAQRIIAKPPAMNVLAASVQVYAQAKIMDYVKKTSFWPQPKIDSAILQVTPFTQAYPVDFPKFFRVVKAGFKQPRKQLVNNLSKGLALPRPKAEQWLLANNIQPSRRAQTLSVQDWLTLVNML